MLGLDPAPTTPSSTRRIGVMLQDGGVYTGIRPLEVLRLFASYYDDPADPDELLERVGLADRRRLDLEDTSRAASSSGCRWPWPWSADPRSPSSTSPPPASTRAVAS